MNKLVEAENVRKKLDDIILKFFLHIFFVFSNSNIFLLNFFCFAGFKRKHSSFL
ncbi:hypothetical protein KFK09_009243 [Dendrobium nobile]|uniref:Uncharacterized protein n=1 Tax=Dendrobium nobile TaxID=94219 RepID=A0A8T3BRV1_DENNO|nr:hypothetical protein KFK09_009243 [Dendrobium nobile]